MRCTVDLLTPNSRANLRHDQCVLPSCGFCAAFLWGRIWVWFWLLPAIAGVIWFLIERTLK